MNWREYDIESWLDFVSVLEKTGGVYWYGSLWSFRGQADRSWPLRSTLVRRLLNKGVSDRRYAYALERNIIREFITKFPVYSTLPSVEFARYDLLRWLTLMQHYGCPTRVLDWTDSPYVAAFFACESLHESDGAIFCICDHAYVPLVEKKYKAMKSRPEEDLLWSDGPACV